MTRSKEHFEIILFFAVVCTLGLGAAALGVSFAGGAGEPNDPYQIATAEQLIAISSDPNLYDKCFALTADIDLDPNLPGRKVFQQAVLQWQRPSITILPVLADAPFEGSFDGRGHAVRNCVILVTTPVSSVGLFNSISSKGMVRDLRVEEILVVDLSLAGGVLESEAGGSPYYGGLTGTNDGIIAHCSVTGTVESQFIGTCGGLAGLNSGAVLDCHGDCEVFGASAGGLVGSNNDTGRISGCSAGGIVFGRTDSGGLVGENLGTIQYAAAGGYAQADYYAGGLVGHNSGSIHESCSNAAVSATYYAGGLAAVSSGTITNCYATGPQPIAPTYRDGLVVTNNGILLMSYSTNPARVKQPAVRERVSVQGSGLDRWVYYLDPNKPKGQTSNPFSAYGIALSQAEMKQAASFVGFDFYGDANDGAVGHWYMPPDGSPVLTWQTEITGLAGIPDVSGLDIEKAKLLLELTGFAPGAATSDYSRAVPVGQAICAQPSGYVALGSPVGIVSSLGKYSFSQNPGDGSLAKPYQVSTPGQLDSLYGSVGAQHFILTADIDLSRYAYSGPIFQTFSGQLNGNGHTIRSLQVSEPLPSTPLTPATYSNSCYGLLGTIGADGLVHDLTIEQACLRFPDENENEIGILAGVNNGQVTRCKVTGQITGGSLTVGGLVGDNAGQMTDCLFSGQVRATGDSSYVGGLAGGNAGTITRCSARDIDVSGGSAVGGLVGATGFYATVGVEACYATGAVRGTTSVGGLIGQNGAISGVTRSSGPGPLPSTVAVTVRQCYAACSVTGQQSVGGCIGWASATAQQESCFFLALADGGGPDNGLGAPLTGEQMKHQAGFPGWDFVDTWTICEGRDYPRLRWEQVECDK